MSEDTVAIGVDLGGTKIAAGVVNVEGRVLDRAELPSSIDDPDAVGRQVAELVSLLRAAEGAVGMGMGAAGIVDHTTGRYLYGPNTGLRDVDLAGLTSEVVGMPVRLDNDANCAAWAEHRFGVGRGCRNFLCVTLGTGIGGGIVADGKPYRGAHGGAGEIGHMLMDPAGPPCGCGRLGCWEQFASGLALERMARDELPQHPESALALLDPPVRGPAITKAARDGDWYAGRLVERLARWVGWGLASLVNVLEPERIAMAGGIAKDWDLIAPVALEAMQERMEAADRRTQPDVVPASLGPNTGIVGAALLVLDESRG